MARREITWKLEGVAADQDPPDVDTTGIPQDVTAGWPRIEWSIIGSDPADTCTASIWYKNARGQWGKGDSPGAVTGSLVAHSYTDESPAIILVLTDVVGSFDVSAALLRVDS